MPTYDYVCERGHRFEAFQSMKDEPLSACQECGARAKRLIGPGAGFLFRGDGFYITDYRSKSYKDKASAETTPKSEGTPSKQDAAAAKGDPGATKGDPGGAKGDPGGAKGDPGGTKGDPGGAKGDAGSTSRASPKPGKPKDPGKGS